MIDAGVPDLDAAKVDEEHLEDDLADGDDEVLRRGAQRRERLPPSDAMDDVSGLGSGVASGSELGVASGLGSS